MARGSGNSTPKTKSTKQFETEQEEKRIRKEEIFDLRVAEIVRKRVFRQAAESFAVDGEFGIDIVHVLPELLAKMWSTSNSGNDSQTLNQVIRPIMKDITDEPNGFEWGTWRSEDSFGKIRELSELTQKRMLFLFIHGNKGHCYYDRYESQKSVRALADEYQIDYRLLDAQVRLEVAQEKAKKHVIEFERYLRLVEEGATDPLIPRPYSDKWDPSKRD